MPTGVGKRLVIVDDDQDIVWWLRDLFEAEGYDVETFIDAPPMLRYVQKHGLPHLALIDLKLPAMHGFELSEQLKSMGDVPIVFITSNDQVETVVHGLMRYADDYVIKPIEGRELVARVYRVLSRMLDFNYTKTPVIVIDDYLSVDFGSRSVTLGDRSVSLTPTEMNLLHILMRNAGRVVASETLIARVWPNDVVYEDTLRVHMHRLRRKIEPESRRSIYIRTERGVGYRFKEIGEEAAQQLKMAFN
ncbi:MAG: response regulator transcription factor [Anaerolineae bacterium]|nr:response regulator transcription factor [Anaerolineae bacterium]